MKKEVLVETSARHVHVSREALDILFGEGYELTHKKDLSQPGQYACEERVAVVGSKSSFPAVSILGPVRPATQVELSLTDARTIGVVAPVRESGDIANSGSCVIEGPCGSVEVECGVIAAKRHIHMTPEDAMKYGIKDNDLVDVEIQNSKPTKYYDVQVRVHKDFNTEMHIDTDDANASAIKTGDRVEILAKK